LWLPTTDPACDNLVLRFWWVGPFQFGIFEILILCRYNNKIAWLLLFSTATRIWRRLARSLEARGFYLRCTWPLTVSPFLCVFTARCLFLFLLVDFGVQLYFKEKLEIFSLKLFFIFELF
jgi:hypothetical protein